MLKIIGYTLLSLIVLVSIGASIFMGKFNKQFLGEKPNYLAYTSDPEPIRFDWGTSESAGHYEPHAFMLIPVSIPGVPKRLSLQFDTGAPHSLLYGKTLQSLREHGLLIGEVKDGEKLVATDLKLMAGETSIDISAVRVLAGYGNSIDWNDTSSVIKLGTIGADFIDNRIVDIDFKRQQIQLYDDRPEWLAALPNFQAFTYEGRRLLLPTKIHGKKRLLLYDSGCSAFGLITSKNRFKKYTNKADPEIAYAANRWGDALPIHHKPSQEIITLGGSELPLRRVSYVDMYAGLQRFMTPFTRIGGWLGNKPFTESRLIIDTQQQEFVVLTGDAGGP